MTHFEYWQWAYWGSLGAWVWILPKIMTRNKLKDKTALQYLSRRAINYIWSMLIYTILVILWGETGLTFWIADSWDWPSKWPHVVTFLEKGPVPPLSFIIAMLTQPLCDYIINTYFTRPHEEQQGLIPRILNAIFNRK